MPYITASIYDTFARYIDLSDEEFFHEAINQAKNVYEDIKDQDIASVKKQTPVIFASSLVSQKAGVDDFASRKTLVSDRAKRRFLMIDADFNKGEEFESDKLREKLISLADELKTPLILYPTASYPDKPRFRAVLFSKTALNSVNYWKAMTWLFKALRTKPNDSSDMRLSANRNLPIFINEEQLEAIYDTTQDKSLVSLDKSLWQDIEAPAKKEITEEQKEDMVDVSYNETKLLTLVPALANSSLAAEYESFWKIVSSFAAAVILDQISISTAEEAMDLFAEAASNARKITEWKIGNAKLLVSFITKYKHEPAELMKARPLSTYKELMNAVNSGSEEKENE